MIPTQVQTVQVLSEARLCVGYQSGFSIYNISGDHLAMRKLFWILILNLMSLSCIKLSTSRVLKKEKLTIV